MSEARDLCTAVNEGADCTAEATMKDPVPLCDEHVLQIVLLAVPDLVATALRQAKAGMSPVTLAPDERAAVIAGARPRPIGAYLRGVHGPVVYFADSGNRIKIGHSTNLRNRIRSLSLQEKDIVLLLQGGLTLERALQANFAKERIDATEWFAKSDRLMGFIGSKLAELDGRHRQKMQHQQRKRMAPSASNGPSPSTIQSSRWAKLAEPLYRKFAAENNGATPSAPVLANLLRSAHPDLKIPASERSERIIRAATEALIHAGGGQV